MKFVLPRVSFLLLTTVLLKKQNHKCSFISILYVIIKRVYLIIYRRGRISYGKDTWEIICF